MEYRASECQFFTVGGGFDQYKILKVGYMPGEGMLHLRFDRRISPVHVLQMSPVQVLQNESSPGFTKWVQSRF